MPLTLDALTVLDAIERRGAFARAAEEVARAPSSLTYLAWRSNEAGRALEWWTRALSQPGVLAEVLDAV